MTGESAVDIARWSRTAALALLLCGVLAALLNRDAFDADAISDMLDSAGALAPLAFISIYALAAVLFLPGLILTMLAGVLFGPWLGTLYSLTGATLGAILAFLTARHLMGDRVEAMVDEGRLAQLKQGVEQEGWRFVAFTRLVPLFPYNLLNYAFGLTRIRLLDYVWPTAVFMIPGAFAYVYLGYAGSEAISGGENAIRTTLVAIALLAAVAYLPRLVKRLRTGVSIEEQ